MLIGGFYSVDGELLCQPKEKEDFILRLDTEHCYKRKIYTSNGRTASVYAMKHCAEKMKGKKVLLPDYLCLSVISAAEWAGVSYDFYRVKANLEIDLDDLIAKLDDTVGMIYVIHYFSIPQPRWIAERIQSIAKKKNILIMEDITQTMFSKEEGRMGFGDYIVGSTRKWFPMTDGGILAIRDGISGEEQELENAYDESVYKELLISVMRPQYEKNSQLEKQLYLTYEKEANASRYKNLTPRQMTDASRHILFHTDTEKLIRKRIENFQYLYQGLSKIPQVEILSKRLNEEGNFVPFGLTILVEDRQELYNHLVERNIIPEIQWILPTEYYVPGNDAQKLSDHNLMLQCDQRYEPAHMEQIVEAIQVYYK